MDTRKVAPETTDIITHVSDGSRSMRRVAPRTRADMMQQREQEMPVQPPEPRRRSQRDDDLVFGTIPKMTIGLIALGLMFILALIFGIKELEISIPVFLIILVFCTVMGVLLSKSPGFVSVIVAALLLVAGGLTSLFPAVAIGGTMLVSGALILKGE